MKTILFLTIMFLPVCGFSQQSKYIVIPNTIYQLYNSQSIGGNDIFNCAKTVGGRWVSSANILKYYPGIVDSIANAFHFDIDTTYLPIDSFVAPVFTPTVTPH